MKLELINILVDPKTKEPLTLRKAIYVEGDIDSGELISPSGNVFPIRNGIPRFVDLNNYSDSFGLQWNRFARTQLDSVTGRDYTRKRFEKEVGWDKAWGKGKWILDAGCGAGRFAEISANLSCNLVAMDMSSAIDAAKANLSNFKNIDFVQADLFNMPFRKEAFDGVYCIGVLQHTPDPYSALRFLLGVLSPEGKFAFTIYAKRPWTKLFSKYWVRAMVREIDQKKLLYAVEKIMPIAFPVTDVLFRIPALGKLMKFLIPIANYVERDDLTRNQRYEEAILDTFDMLAPKFDSPVVANRVIDIVQKYGANNYKMISNRPVNIVGNKTSKNQTMASGNIL